MIVITTPTGDIGHQVLQLVVQGSEPGQSCYRHNTRWALVVRHGWPLADDRPGGSRHQQDRSHGPHRRSDRR